MNELAFGDGVVRTERRQQPGVLVRRGHRPRAALRHQGDHFEEIPVGYPAGNFGPLSRRPVTESIHWEKW